MSITETQAKYIFAINDGLVNQDQVPPMEQIAQAFDVYPTAVNDMFKRLESKGVIERNSFGRWKRGHRWKEAVYLTAQYAEHHVRA